MRSISPQIVDLNGVWTYPKEQPGETSVTVIEGLGYRIYDYFDDIGYDLSRTGRICGQEGVYFFPDDASFYSPKFLAKANGKQFFIPNRHSYDEFIRDGSVKLSIWIQSAAILDKSSPPIRHSIESLNLPYSNPFKNTPPNQ